MKLAVVSDLHIGQRGSVEATRALLADIRTRHPGAIVVATGDITDTPSLSECLSAARCFSDDDELLPGNHDTQKFGLLRWPGLRKQWHAALDVDDVWPRVRDIGHGRLILMDSTRDLSLRRFALARGYAGRDQINAVRVALETDRPCVVAVHHDLIDQKPTLNMIDAELLLSTLNAGGCRVALCGHLHRAAEAFYGRVHLLASDKSTSSMRYRVLEVEKDGGVSWSWQGVGHAASPTMQR